MKKAAEVAFIGARGIPAKYGGTETFVEEVCNQLKQSGFKFYVTCNSDRFYKDEYNGIVRIHSPSLQGKTLTVPAVNEIIGTIHVLASCPKVDIVYYVLSYGSFVAAIPKLLGKRIMVFADGIEWKRPVIRQPFFSGGWKVIALLTAWFMQFSEWLAIKMSHVVVADSRAIKTYLEDKYKAKNVVYIAHGARELLAPEVSSIDQKEVLQKFGLTGGDYYLSIARVVPENNIHLALEGFKKSKSVKKMVHIGNFNPKDNYTKHLLKLKGNNPNLILMDSVYDRKELFALRNNSFAYIHTNQLGGTSLSLLEQLFFGKPIIAYDVPFNTQVLLEGGIYFHDEDSLAKAIDDLEFGKADLTAIAESHTRRIKEEYNWDYIGKEYYSLFTNVMSMKK